jgi:hypothetical protein
VRVRCRSMSEGTFRPRPEPRGQSTHHGLLRDRHRGQLVSRIAPWRMRRDDRRSRRTGCGTATGAGRPAHGLDGRDEERRIDGALEVFEVSGLCGLGCTGR